MGQPVSSPRVKPPLRLWGCPGIAYHDCGLCDRAAGAAAPRGCCRLHQGDPWTRACRRAVSSFVKFAVVGLRHRHLLVLKATLFRGPPSRPTFGVENSASGLAFAVAVVNNYLLNRWRHALPQLLPQLRVQFLKFLIVSIAGLGLNELAF